MHQNNRNTNKDKKGPVFVLKKKQYSFEKNTLEMCFRLTKRKGRLVLLLIGFDAVHFLFDFLQNFFFALGLNLNLLST